MSRAEAVKALLEQQADDHTLWFGTDAEYVRAELRKLTGLLEGEDMSWLQGGDT